MGCEIDAGCLRRETDEAGRGSLALQPSVSQELFERVWEMMGIFGLFLSLLSGMLIRFWLAVFRAPSGASWGLVAEEELVNREA